MKKLIFLFFVSAFALTSFTAENSFTDNPTDLISSEITMSTQVESQVLSPEEMIIVQNTRACRNSCFQAFLHHGNLSTFLDCLDYCDNLPPEM